MERHETAGGWLERDPKYDVWHGYTAAGHYLGVFRTRREAALEVEFAGARK